MVSFQNASLSSSSLPSTKNNNQHNAFLNLDDESIAKIVFLRLDPIIRFLLRTVKEYHAAVVASKKNIANNNHMTRNTKETTTSIATIQPNQQQQYQREIGLLQLISHTLISLTRMINDPVYQYQGYYNLDEDQVRCSLCMLFDYISLPLLAILRMPTKENPEDNKNGNEENGSVVSFSNNQLLIRQSARWKSIQLSSQCLQAIISRIYGIMAKVSDDIDNKNKDDRRIPIEDCRSHYLSSQMIVKCLMACTSALPTGNDIIAKRNNRYNNNTSNNSPNVSSLDTGEEYAISIFKAICCMLVHCFGCPDSDSDSTTKTRMIIPQHQQKNRIDDWMVVFDVMEGALVSQILDSAVAFIEPESSASVGTMSTQTSVGLESTTTRTMQIAALDTIYSLLLLSLSCSSSSSKPNGLTTSVVRCHWYKVFPGVYAGLYRRIMHSLRISIVKGSEIVILAVKTLCLLLRVCLGGPNNHSNKYPTNENERSLAHVSDAFDMMHELSKNQGFDWIGADSTKGTDKVTIEFYQQVLQRVPSTLVILINFLTSARSTAIREQALTVGKAILFETGPFWSNNAIRNQFDADDTNSVRLDLTTVAIESCLTLSQDTSEDVAVSGTNLIREYSEISLTSLEIGYSVAPRIISILKSLPVLAQGKREIELKSHIQLISGYLALNTSQKKSIRALRASLCSESSLSIIRNSLTFLLDVDFGPEYEIVHGATTNPAKSLIVVLSPSEYKVQRHENNSTLRYLSQEIENILIHMIHTFGKVIGPKHASIYADECVADLFQSFVVRSKDKIDRRDFERTFNDRSQAGWLHERIGSIRLVREIMIGAFSIDSKSQTNSKDARKRLQWLETIAKSILPLLMHHALWDLPMILNDAKGRPTYGSSRFLSNVPSTTGSYPNESIEATPTLRGNTCVIELLLDLIGTIFELLGVHGKQYIGGILYSIVEKTSSLHPRTIQDSAKSTLVQIAFHCQLNSMSEMLTDHIGALASSLLGKLRVPGGKSLSLSNCIDISVTSALCAATSAFHFMLDDDRIVQTEATFEVGQWLPSIEDISEDFLTRFDYCSTHMKDDETDPLRFLGLFNIAINLLLLAYQHTGVEQQNEETGKSDEPWLELLEEFYVDGVSKLTPAEGFEMFRAKKEAAKNTQIKPNESIITSLGRDTTFASRVAIRCCYLLCHPSLKVQVKSVEVLADCFIFLGNILSDTQTPDEANGPKTAILRLVHTAWPSISSRLKAVSSMLTLSGSTSLVIIRTQQKLNKLHNEGEQRVYLSKLYNLISVMVECADDFMATRFREVIWPSVGQILGNYLRQHHLQCQTNKMIASESEPQSFLHNLSSSEKGLVQSVLICISRVFRHRPTGETLSGLIPAVATLIFPFSESLDESIASTCVVAIKNMLLIDCDSLYSYLLDISGKYVPPCPLHIRRITPYLTIKRNNTENLQLPLIARELLDFIETLNEQPLR